MKYDNKQIASELGRTALGESYFGNALYVAMDIPALTQDEKRLLHRYLHGSELSMDHVKLQDLAMKIYNLEVTA